jgi:signal peptidase I
MKRTLLRIAATAAAVLFVTTVILMITTNHSYVSTPSMYPTIPPGSMIFVEHESHYHVGDVIEFRGNGLVWAHRIIAIKPGGVFVTKGDNPQNAPDIFTPPTTRVDVIGKVVVAIPWLGFPELIVHSPAYGLAWLRFELGIFGRVALLLAALGLSTFVALGGRRDRQRTGELAAAA